MNIAASHNRPTLGLSRFARAFNGSAEPKNDATEAVKAIEMFADVSSPLVQVETAPSVAQQAIQVDTQPVPTTNQDEQAMSMKDIESTRKALLEAQAKAKEIEEKLNELRQAEKANVLARVKDDIGEFGITLDDLRDVLPMPVYQPMLGDGAAKRVRRTREQIEADKAAGGGVANVRGKVAPKYKNPANIFETWTGRGKQPKWVVAALAEGKTLEQMLIVRE